MRVRKLNLNCQFFNADIFAGIDLRRKITLDPFCCLPANVRDSLEDIPAISRIRIDYFSRYVFPVGLSNKVVEVGVQVVEKAPLSIYALVVKDRKSVVYG